REREKEERERVRAENAEEAAERKAQRERDEQARDAQKASVAPRKKQNCGAVAAQRGVVAAEPPAAPCTHTTRSGRTATLYN
ncbi:uncharacterized protein M421DRAFT_415878, partial [Didymella exigua CBS 183.55]